MQNIIPDRSAALTFKTCTVIGNTFDSNTVAETTPCACIHGNRHQLQIKEDTGEPSALAKEVNLRPHLQDIQDVPSFLASKGQNLTSNTVA